MTFDKNKYFHGRPCKRGHTLRRLSDRHCVACNSDRNKKWQRENPEKVNARNRAYRAKNLDAVRQFYRDRYVRCKTEDPRKYMLQCAKRRAKEAGMLCTITLDDIVIPDKCPLLGIVLSPNKGGTSANSPSLDRILNEYGYVPGNVQVVSYQANARKGELNSETLTLLANNLRNLERAALKAVAR